MEYVTDIVTAVPEGTSPAKVDEFPAAEAVRTAELAKPGYWLGSEPIFAIVISYYFFLIASKENL